MAASNLGLLHGLLRNTVTASGTPERRRNANGEAGKAQREAVKTHNERRRRHKGEAGKAHGKAMATQGEAVKKMDIVLAPPWPRRQRPWPVCSQCLRGIHVAVFTSIQLCSPMQIPS